MIKIELSSYEFCKQISVKLIKVLIIKKANLNKWVLSDFFKLQRCVLCLIFAGRRFQSTAALTSKCISPNCFVRTRGLARNLEFLVSNVCIGTHNFASSWMYNSAVPWNALKQYQVTYTGFENHCQPMKRHKHREYMIIARCS